MDKLALKIWEAMSGVAKDYSEKDARVGLVKQFQRVLCDHRKILDRDIFKKYPIFSFLLAIDVEEYVFENASQGDSAYSIKDIFRRISPSSEKVIASMLAEILTGLVEFKSDVECPSCMDDNLVALYSQQSRSVLLCCNTCGWVQELDGKKWNGNETLVPPKKELIFFAGLRT